MLFDVRLVAFDDAAVADPVDALVRVFGLDRHAASELLRRLPHVVKRGVTEEGARKLVSALERIGAHTEIVLSPKKAREPSAVQSLPQPNSTARLGALPAPSAAARAMIDARAAREKAATERALLARASMPQPAHDSGRSAPYGYAASATAFDHEHDEDSLEADIGTQSRSVTPMLERSTVAMDRPPAAINRGTPTRERTTPAERSAPPERSSLAAVTRGAKAARAPAVAAQSPSRASRASMPQPNTAAAQPLGAPPVAAAPQAFAPIPVTQSFAVAPQPVATFTMSLPQVTPANLQRAAPALGAVSALNVPVARQRPALPTLSIHGPPVEAGVCVMPGTKSAWFLAWLIAIVLTATLTVLSLGILPVVSLVAVAVGWLSRRRTLAAVRASALPVGQSQLPEVYACVKQFSLRLGLSTVPRFYIVRSEREGLRTAVDGRELVFMIDENTLLRFVESAQPQGLSFLIAHELCRHVLGHTKWTRRFLSRVSPRLACLDLVSADSAATALVSDHAVVKSGLLTLLGAARLHAYLDQDELDRVATSTTREPAFWPTRFGADDGFVLARLYHLQRGYV